MSGIFGFLIVRVIFLRTGMIGISSYKFIPYTITAIMGVFLMMSVGWKRITEIDTLFTRYLNYVGSHTYDILMMHIICFKITTLIILLINGADIKELANYPTYHYYTEKGWFLVYIIIGVNLPLYIGCEYKRIKQLIMRIKK